MRNLLLVSLVLLSGCQYFQPKEVKTEDPVARVGENTLTRESLKDLTPNNLSAADSATFAEKFILDWVKKRLLIGKAEQAIDFNEARIQKKVLDYQYALMVHEYEKKYIEANINDAVSEEEIAGYYAEKKENFILRQNLAKAVYFKIPRQAPNLWRFRRAIRNYPADSTELWDYADEHAVKAFVEDSVWIKFDEVLMETPLRDVNDKSAFLKTNRSVEVSDDEFVYFLKIFEYRIVGDIAPMEFIEENIIDIIINKRKIELKKALEKEIYDEAVQNNTFEIYTDDN